MNEDAKMKVEQDEMQRAAKRRSRMRLANSAIA